MVRGGLERLRHLSLKGKVTLTLTAVFATIVTVFLLVLVPFLRQQRHRLLERDKRFLSTLRDNYQRRFIHDLLSENAESLAVDVADLARQSGILWVRIEAEGVELSATAEPALIRLLEGRLFKAGQPRGATCNCVTCGASSLAVVALILLSIQPYAQLQWTTLTIIAAAAVPVGALLCGLLSRREKCKIQAQATESDSA